MRIHCKVCITGENVLNFLNLSFIYYSNFINLCVNNRVVTKLLSEEIVKVFQKALVRRTLIPFKKKIATSKETS